MVSSKGARICKISRKTPVKPISNLNIGELSQSKEKKEKESALEIRRVAMENLAQSKKRKEACKDEVKKKKIKKTGSDTTEYLKEKRYQEAAIKDQELKIRAKEVKVKEDIEKQRF